MARGCSGVRGGHRVVAQLGGGALRRQCARHVQLVIRRGNRIAGLAVPPGRAGRAAAVRPRQGTDRGRILGGPRPAILRRPRPPRHRSRAAATHGLGTQRARLDGSSGADRAAVNVYFHTFGCKANQYDTERVREAFDANGAVVVDDPALADLAIINSCTVTNESEVKLRRFVRHVAKRGHTQTIVMGCAAALDHGGLLEALIESVPSVRFRLGSVEATEVDDTLARLLIEAPRSLAAHLHAPLQSGANRVLKRMGRHWYTAESYRARIEWLAERLPVFGLGADVIAGFPSETDADHHASLALLNALPFTYLHVFPFSVRRDAPAARLPGQLPPEVIRDRARELRELGEAKATAHRRNRRGQRADGVVSGRLKGHVEVMTEDYLSVYLDTDLWDGRPRFEVTVN